MRYGLKPSDWNLLETKLISPLKAHGAKVWIFGSRVTGSYRPFSDVDILYDSEEELPGSFIYELKSDIEESDLSVKVDLLSVRDMAETYKEHVLRTRIEL